MMYVDCVRQIVLQPQHQQYELCCLITKLWDGMSRCVTVHCSMVELILLNVFDVIGS